MSTTTNETSTTYVPAPVVAAARTALKANLSTAAYLAAETRGQWRAALAFLAEYQDGTTYAQAREAYGWSDGTTKNRLTLGALLARLGEDATEDLARKVQPTARKVAPNLDALAEVLAGSDATGEAWAEYLAARVAAIPPKPRAAHKKDKGEDKGEGTDARTGETREPDAPRKATDEEILAAAVRVLTIAAHAIGKGTGADDDTPEADAQRAALALRPLVAETFEAIRAYTDARATYRATLEATPETPEGMTVEAAPEAAPVATGRKPRARKASA